MSQISASQVHLRLEDEQSSAEEPVATGVVVEGAALANAQVRPLSVLKGGREGGQD